MIIRARSRASSQRS